MAFLTSRQFTSPDTSPCRGIIFRSALNKLGQFKTRRGLNCSEFRTPSRGEGIRPRGIRGYNPTNVYHCVRDRLTYTLLNLLYPYYLTPHLTLTSVLVGKSLAADSYSQSNHNHLKSNFQTSKLFVKEGFSSSYLLVSSSPHPPNAPYFHTTKIQHYYIVTKHSVYILCPLGIYFAYPIVSNYHSQTSAPLNVTILTVRRRRTPPATFTNR